MKKFIIFIFIYFCFFYSYQVQANWYADGTATYGEGHNGSNCGSTYCTTTPNVVTLCTGDGEDDDGNPGEIKGQLTPDSNAPSSGTVTCYSWDSRAFDKNEDILESNPNGILLADNDVDFSLSVDDRGGAPLKYIKISVEDVNNIDTYPSTQTLASASPVSLTGVDFSKVDNDISPNDGYRDYKIYIHEVCDEANNCTSYSDFYLTYSVVANSNGVLANVITNELDDVEFANGQPRTLTINLQDEYGNKIIPVLKSGFSRDIDINFDVSNNLNINQYLLDGQDAVFLDTPNEPGNFGNRLSSSNSFDDLESTTGNYSFDFKVYAPTYKFGVTDGREKAVGDFIINNITYDIDQTFSPISGGVINNSNIDAEFKPIYTSIFSEYPWERDGFIEGATQTGTLAFNGSCVGCSNTKGYLEFGKNVGDSLDYLDLSISSPVSKTIGEGSGSMSEITSQINQTHNLGTLVTQTGGYIDELQNAYISSHVSYTLDGKNITYNTDVIGKENYWFSADGLVATQVGLKVFGNTQSQNQKDIMQDQAQDDIHLLGKSDKSLLKQDMRSNAFTLIKEVNVSNGDYLIDEISSSTWNKADQDAGIILSDNTILYFGPDGNSDDIELSPNANFIGQKTILVVGKNVYITKNVISTDGAHTLGIVVLKDKNGNGGNLYIDPDVTQIHATIFTDKSLISYSDSLGELDGSTNQYTLRNQLYIQGSVFSENTIGGSRSTPPMCPYYVEELMCTMQEAQKYDLNYIRRYYLDSSKEPVNEGEQVFTSSPNNQYPIIIEYDPVVQSFPPPLFAN